MIFPIVRLLTHVAGIYFLKFVFCQQYFLHIQVPVILTFFDTSDLYSKGAAHSQSN